MFTIDQQSTGTFFGRDWIVRDEASAGQEFVPSASSLNAVEVAVAPTGRGLPLARVRIREDTITGTIVGSSDAVFVSSPAPPAPLIRFDFSPQVALQPGTRYVIEIVPLGTEIGMLGSYSPSGDSYPGGRMIEDGVPNDIIVDGGGRLSLKFAEGFDDGATPPRRLVNIEEVFVALLGGAPAGGPGIGILPGGGIVRIPPHLPVLHPSTRQALIGLTMREMASLIDDAAIRRTIEQASARLVRKSLEPPAREG